MQICKLEEEKNKELTVEQKMKIQRKSTLSDELKELEAWLELSPDLVAEEEKRKESQKKMIASRQGVAQKNNTPTSITEKADNNKALIRVGRGISKPHINSKFSSTAYVCKICSVEFMDEKAYQSHLNGKRHKKQMQKKSEKGLRAEIQNKKTPVKSLNMEVVEAATPVESKNLLTPSQDKQRRPSWSSPEAKLNGPKSPSLLTIMMQESQRSIVVKDNAKSSKTKSAQKKKNSWQQINSKREKRDHSLVGSMNSKNELRNRNQVQSKPIRIPTSSHGDSNSNGRSNPLLIRQGKLQQHSNVQNPRYHDASGSSSMPILGRSASPTSSNIYGQVANRRGFNGYRMSPSKHSLSPSSGPLHNSQLSQGSSPSLSLGSFMSRMGGSTPDRPASSPWRNASTYNQSKSPSSENITPHSASPSMSLMEIMEKEAKRKKEEKYTNARLDMHQTKWYQRDEDTRQASLEEIMKSEQAEAERREAERKILDESRKRADSTRKHTHGGRGGRKTKQDKKRNKRRKSKKENGTSKTKKSGLSVVIMPTSINV